MNQTELFTIGHSNRSMEEFVALLADNQLTAVADVRSQPYSRRHPHFNAEPLKLALKLADIHYVFLGKELGARRSEPESYDQGQAKYELIARTEIFRRGLDRVRRGMQFYRVALLCAEQDPLICHRMILVCRHLRQECVIGHIMDVGQVEPQDEAESRLLESVGLPLHDLFQNRHELLKQAYEIQGNRIAFREDMRTGAKTPGRD